MNGSVSECMHACVDDDVRNRQNEERGGSEGGREGGREQQQGVKCGVYARKTNNTKEGWKKIIKTRRAKEIERE